MSMIELAYERQALPLRRGRSNRNQQINRLFLLATAPFLGMMIWLFAAGSHQVKLTAPVLAAPPPSGFSVSSQTSTLEASISKASEDTTLIRTTIEKVYEKYEQSAGLVNDMLAQATVQAARPAAIFDNRIAASLGKPAKEAHSAAIDLQLYQFSERSYKAYALKANLKSNQAMRMILGLDKIGSAGETTLSAVSRYGAVAGINAGGFADDGRGRRYPTGTTMYNGKYVYGFFPSEDDMAFVGLDGNRKLVGGVFQNSDDLDKLKPQFGASFVPVLLKGGHKQTIPTKWMTTPYRAPRTVIGSFRNGQILALVTDGYDESGNSGASLAELQDLLQQLGIQDAYNLDGGGSSTLVWGNQVINTPSDGRMRALPTHFLFFK